MYRCVAATVEGFIQQIAVSYVLHGYFRYVTGEVQKGNDPEELDTKLRGRYELDISKWVRARRRKRGEASVQYFRHGRAFVLLATDGVYEPLRSEPGCRDVRKDPLRLFRYEIGCYRRASGRWHPSVRVERASWRRVVRWFRSRALSCDAHRLQSCINRLPFAPFAPVRGQVFSLVVAINRRRKRANLPLVSLTSVRRRRKPVKVYVDAPIPPESTAGLSH